MKSKKIKEDIVNVTGPAVATDIPFKPKVKIKPEELSKRFSQMYEEAIKEMEEQNDPVLMMLRRKKK